MNDTCDDIADIRARRSVLYMPGANARALEKAKTLDCDGIILDLEDAVAPDRKAAAREQVAAAVEAGGYGHREVVVRINRLDTPWGRDDLARIAPTAPDAILLPKVESADEIAALEGALAELGASSGIALWAMIETPRGVLAADGIAAASPRLKALVMGTSDLAKELHARHVPGREPFLFALERCVMAARSSTGSISISPTKRDCAPNANRARRWASTARRSSTRSRSPSPTRPSGRRTRRSPTPAPSSRPGTPPSPRAGEWRC